MPISREKKIIFVHIPKTAGSSIEKALQIYGIDNRGSNTYSSQILFGQYRCQDKIYFAQHLYAKEIKKEVGGNFYDNCFSFTFVRNPYERIVSEYIYTKLHTKMNFAQFVHDVVVKNNKLPLKKDRDRHCKNQKSFILGKNGKILVDFVGRYERLNDDLKKIQKITGISFKNLLHINKTRKKNYKSYYDDETKKIIAKVYKEDLEMFGYDF